MRAISISLEALNVNSMTASFPSAALRSHKLGLETNHTALDPEYGPGEDGYRRLTGRNSVHGPKAYA